MTDIPRNSEWFRNSLQTFEEYLQKISERYVTYNHSYKWMKLEQMYGWTNGLTDAQTNTDSPRADPTGG